MRRHSPSRGTAEPRGKPRWDAAQRTSAGTAQLPNTGDTKCSQRYAAAGTPRHAGGKTVWPFLPKSNTVLPHHPASARLGIYPNELKTYGHTKTRTRMLTAA